MAHPVISPKKLIEVALPLDAINKEAAREKSIRHGHPSTLHLWWARRPLAAARAVIFGQLVNDPESLWLAQNPGKTPSLQQRGGFTQRRKYLFELISELVKWENTTNEDLLGKARAEIQKSWREVCELNKDHPEAATLFNPEKLPGLHDPFAGGGTIPLEAQRLGLKAYASDLNPVAVLINKAMIEIPPKFAGMPPVHPGARKDKELFKRQWKGAEGLAEDVRRYGAWMRDEAEKRIGHLYPKVKVTTEMAKKRPDLKPLVGQELTVIAWLWARTVKSPNPAFSHVDVPLVSSFVLSSKPGKENWVEPIVEGDGYRFEVRRGSPSEETRNGTKIARGSFRCIISGTPIPYDYIDKEANAGRMGQRLLAIVAEGKGHRLYLSPIQEHTRIALSAQPTWKPEAPSRGTWASNAQGRKYGFHTFGDYFTARQLAALTTLSDLASEAESQVQRDLALANQSDSETPPILNDSTKRDYARAISTYLACAVSRMANYSATLCVWSSHPKDELAKQVFLRQAISMTWDYAETNPFSSAGGTLEINIEYLKKAIERLPGHGTGRAQQAEVARAAIDNRFVSTDPPYYDNISYADLSDYFYVWLRRSLRTLYPELFASMAVPKQEELVASQYRHDGKEEAEAFFLDGMTAAMRRLHEQAHPEAPVTVFYAFKESETKSSTGTSSTGWETFLDALLRAGFAISGTWPMRTELVANLKRNVDALASSIVLVCRKRPEAAATVSRREFLRELNAVLPEALEQMTKGAGEAQAPVAPVDLSQAIIGPGMEVFSKYAAVLEADGTPMTVKTALQLINRFLAEDDFDADTQFCLHWFDQHGWDQGAYGDADVLARAKATSVGGLDEAGVLLSGSGKVRLRRPADYPEDWDPRTDKRLPVWELLHQLIRLLRKDGESGAGVALAARKDLAEPVRQLAYRLYTLCERRGWAEDARAYNELVTSWPALETAANAVPETPTKKQLSLFGEQR